MCRGSKDNIGDEDKSVIELRKSFKFKNHTKKIPHLDAKNGKIEIDSKNPKQVKWFEETNQLPQSTILDCGLFIENHSFCISFFYRSKWKNNPPVIIAMNTGINKERLSLFYVCSYTLCVSLPWNIWIFSTFLSNRRITSIVLPWLNRNPGKIHIFLF